MPVPRVTIACYVSGHGLGHASRVIEVLRALRAVGGGTVRIVVRTAAPRWLFELTLGGPAGGSGSGTAVPPVSGDIAAGRRPPRADCDTAATGWPLPGSPGSMSTGTGSTPGDVELRPGECDTGIVQIDALCPDVRASVLRAAAFHRGLDRRAAEEAMLLRDAGAALVVADMPPLAFAAAARAGIPAMAFGNFTWDWIYEGYPETAALAPDLVPTLREAYRMARGAWRLPMWGGFEGIENVVDVPFVARRAARDPRETRRAFGLPADTPVALVSFGGYGIRDLAWDRLDCLADYTVVVTDVPGAGGGFRARPPRLVHLDDAAIYGRGWRYEDLVAAADVVVTKPGYGIIAECIANRTALLYTSRGPFREYDVLVREMPRYLRCGFIDQEALRAGRWRAALDAVLARPRPPETPRVDGA
ncbi:MAG TPA: hypothetical protein VNK92_01385, partial [Vicinamibacterales bacterium]|nr:hypothetical protein [Vicinamibacterales bacterium]